MNKKKISFIVLAIILLLILFIFCMLNSNKTITCELKKDNYNNVVSIKKDNYINFNYEYTFNTIEESVNQYDIMTSYINLILKLNGVEANINQNKNEMEYSINIDLNKLSKHKYKLLEIDNIVNLSNKEIKEYYEELGYVCK